MAVTTLHRILLLTLGTTAVLADDGVGNLLETILETWKDDVTNEIRADVLNEAKVMFELKTQTLQKQYEVQKTILLNARQRLSDVTKENLLLQERVTKLHNGSNAETCSSGSYTSGNHGNKGTMVVGERHSGDIWMIDLTTLARWKMKAPKGILSIAYHPVTRMLYVAVAYTRSGIVSVSVPDGQLTLIKPCYRCLGLGLDARENILFHIQDEHHGTRSFINKFDLLKNKTVGTLVSYSQSQFPAFIAVDEIHRHVFVALRTDEVIEQLDYKGNLLRVIDLYGFNESLPLTMSVDKEERILYYNVGNTLWRVRLDRMEEPEHMDVAEWPRPCGLAVIHGQLVIAYYDNSRIDVWTHTEHFQQIADLRIEGLSGSKSICHIN